MQFYALLAYEYDVKIRLQAFVQLNVQWLVDFETPACVH